MDNSAEKNIIQTSIDMTSSLWIKPAVDIIDMLDLDRLVDRHDTSELDAVVGILRNAITEIEPLANAYRNKEDLQ